MNYQTIESLTSRDVAERLSDDRYYPDASFYALAETLDEVAAGLRDAARWETDAEWSARYLADAELVELHIPGFRTAAAAGQAAAVEAAALVVVDDTDGPVWVTEHAKLLEALGRLGWERYRRAGLPDLYSEPPRRCEHRDTHGCDVSCLPYTQLCEAVGAPLLPLGQEPDQPHWRLTYDPACGYAEERGWKMCWVEE